MSDRMFLDGKISYNNTHFPLYQKTNLQSLLDNSSGIRYYNNTSNAIMFRRRTEVVADIQYYVPELFGGRHELKGGFDNGYTPENVHTTRADNVNLTFNSLPTPAASTVQVFNTPLNQDRAVMSSAFYGQDSYSYKRLNVIGGIRWERIEGYLPAQQNDDSLYFPAGTVFQNVTINGVVQNYTVQKQFAEVRHDPLWHNWAPRVAGTYDLRGDGRTAVKVSYGRYLDQISTGTPPNPNANINQTYTWNDLNGDLQFQPGNAVWNGTQYVGGEFGAVRGATNGLAVATFNQSARRPYRNEFVASVDHQLRPNTAVGVAYIHGRERDQQGIHYVTKSQCSSLYTQVALTDPGCDGILGTSDDKPITVYSLNPGVVTSTVTVNDDRLSQHYNGVDFTVTQRGSHFNMLFGYTYSNTTQQLTSLSNPNNAYVNASGVSGGRRHNLKATGSYEWKYGLLFASNFRLQSGLPTTRTWAIPSCSASIPTNCLTTGTTVNAEPRGSYELPWLPTLDVRVGRVFRFSGNRLDTSIDLYNITNANTVFAIRTGSNTTPIHVNGDPTIPTTQIQTWNSPTQFLGPRVLRFNISYQFGSQ